jgi:hypothetical protein
MVRGHQQLLNGSVQNVCVRVIAPPDTADSGPPERWGSYHEAFQEALKQIKARRGELSLPQATGLVVAECDKRGLKVRHEVARGVARGALHPYWPFKHPIQAHREGWRWSPLGGWLQR